MTKEEQIQKYLTSLGLSREDAEQLWEDDKEDFIGEAGEEMEKNAKKLRRYEKGESNRKKTEKERKVDVDKKVILEECEKALKGMVEITGRKNEVELSFSWNGEDYTLKLTKHRKKKMES